MSFTFNWPRFSDQFHYDAIQMLNNALNKGNKPPIIADCIEVVELEMGTQPPELEIRDIGDLTMDQFRGIFRLTYSGDAHLVLKTKVQANPLNHKQPDIHFMTGSRGMLAAKDPLVVPMLLRLSHFRLNSYVVLVVSKQKGITLVFKTDPLQNVDINSTFDSIAVIQKFIQREIEGQLRQMFREDLPGIIHRLSQQWIKAKVEAPYLGNPRSRPGALKAPSVEFAPSVRSYHSVPAISSRVNDFPHLSQQQRSLVSLRSASYPKRPRSISGYSAVSTSKHKVQNVVQSSLSTPDPVAFPDLENFDPTYGLRPEGLPSKSLFRGFSSLFSQDKGLADLVEDDEDGGDNDEEYEENTASFDVVNWEYTSFPSDCRTNEELQENPMAHSEYETIPAVGGGTITRPRIYHSQSMIQTSLGTPTHAVSEPSFPKLRIPLHSQPSVISPRSGFSTPGVNPHRNTFVENPTGYSLHHPASSKAISFDHNYSIPMFRSGPSYFSTLRRPATPDSMETRLSTSSSGQGFSNSTPPTEPLFRDEETVNEMTSKLRYPHRLPPASSTSSRRASVSAASTAGVIFPSSESALQADFDFASPLSTAIPDPKIVLRPSLNNSIHRLSTLSHSNHTLSPYTRTLNHFTVRSFPPRNTPPLSANLGPVKAKRKRIFRLGSSSGGKAKAPAGVTLHYGVEKERQETEFDISDMDRYFRTYDECDRLDHDSRMVPPLSREPGGYHSDVSSSLPMPLRLRKTQSPPQSHLTPSILIAQP